MALLYATEAAGATLVGKTLREDVVDIITRVSPTDTPFLSRRQRVRATSVIHQCLYETLAARTSGANAVVTEGYTFLDSNPTPAERLTNWCGVFRIDWGFSGTQERVAHYGMSSPRVHYFRKALEELANNIERSFIRNQGTFSAPVQPKGMLNTIGWDTRTQYDTGLINGSCAYVNTTSATLTEEQFCTLLQLAWAEGAKIDEVYTGPYLKRAGILLWTVNTRNVQASAEELYGNVDVYHSPFGRVGWMLSHDVYDTSTAGTYNHFVGVQGDLAKFAVLGEDNVAPEKNFDKWEGMVLVEATLEVRNPWGAVISKTLAHDAF